MEKVSLENFVEQKEVDLYPITLMKYLLNKKRNLTFFAKAADPEFKIRGREYKIDHSDCEICKQKEVDGVLCRQHTSIERVLKAKKVLRDEDTDVLFYKNEIFKQVGDKLVIVYCPHTKLLRGDITDEKVRKVNPITIIDKDLELPEYETVNFKSSELLNVITKCWFNNDYTILSIPESSAKSDWAITANR